MPNDILTRAIDEICDGTHLTADHTSAALAEIMEGRASEVQIGGLPDRAARQGRDRRRAGRPRADDAVPGGPGRDRRARPGRHRRHRRRPDHLQHLDHGGADRRRRRLRGRQARQPLRDAAGAGRPTCSRPSGCEIELRPSRSPTCIDEVGFGFMFAPEAPPGDGPCGAGPQGARGADDLQLARPADQPGRARRPAARRLRPRPTRRRSRRRCSASAATTPWWSTPTTASTSSASLPGPG